MIENLLAQLNVNSIFLQLSTAPTPLKSQRQERGNGTRTWSMTPPYSTHAARLAASRTQTLESSTKTSSPLVPGTRLGLHLSWTLALPRLAKRSPSLRALLVSNMFQTLSIQYHLPLSSLNTIRVSLF